MEDARAWVRWWRLEGLTQMRALLWERWDPLGLRSHGAPEDEYDSYADILASKLKRGNSREDIAEYLTTVLAEDGIITPAWVARCNETAQDLLDWYSTSNAPRSRLRSSEATAQESFDALIREHIAPALKARGFRRTRSTFHRGVGANWEVVNVQRSQFSDADHIKLTVNLAVGIDRLRGGGRDWADGKRPPDYKCHLRVRLGQLLTDEDVWWDLCPEMPLHLLGESLLEAIERYGLPWLEARSEDERLRDTYLADLAAVPSWELHPLRQLVEQLGPPDAVTAVADEVRRRERETPA